MSEEHSVDQLLRIQAMQMAVAYVTELGAGEYDLTPLATEIYEFIKGEVK